MKSSCNTMKVARTASFSGGFTLVELMIVVVIVGILLAIVSPMYLEQVRKTRRADAKDALYRVASLQEQFMLDQRTYTSNMGALGIASDPNAPYVSEEGYYQVTASPCGGGTLANCYTLTASPTQGSPQESDANCLVFVLGSDGGKDATGTLRDESW